MTAFRRLQRSDPGAFQRGARSPVRSWLIGHDEFQRVERDWPDCVIDEGDRVVVVEPFAEEFRLHYGFPNREALRDNLPRLLETALASVDRRQYPGDLYLNYTDHPNRPFAQQVLRGCGFDLEDEWVEMSLRPLPDERPRLPKGFSVRSWRDADLTPLIAVNNEVFGFGLSTLEGARRYVEGAAAVAVLEGPREGLTGFVRLCDRRPDVLIDDLAVREAFRRRGLGRALLSWAFAWAGEQGLAGATLLVELDNAPALALYRKLGFVPGATGLTYRRPMDEEDVRGKREGRGTYIKFGGWR